MITKEECLSILVKLGDEGKAVDDKIKELIIAQNTIPVAVLKFIAEERGIEIGNFYTLLRRNHNKNKSPLYINIIKDWDLNTAEQDIILTLSCLLTQIILYEKKLTAENNFLVEARAAEISKALNEYFNSGDIGTAAKVLKLVKTDLLVLEYINGRRELEQNN